MDLPADLLLLSPQEATRRIALHQLSSVARAFKRLDKPEQAESLHDFRVALRRLRSSLQVWREELSNSVRDKQRRELARIQQTTSAERDAQVGLVWLEQQGARLRPSERAGCAWFKRQISAGSKLDLQATREELQAQFAPLHLRLRARLERMRVEIQLISPAAPEYFGVRWAARIVELANAVIRRLEQISAPTSREQAHAARIRLKRLRYVLEVASVALPQAQTAIAPCKALQDRLGEFNDAHVLQDSLARAMQQAPPLRARAGLLELRLRATGLCESSFARLQTEWLDSNAAALVEAVAELATAAKAAVRPALEIERKFLLSREPQMPAVSRVRHIVQGWLPGERIRERIRKVREGRKLSYWRTLKFGRGVQRTEIEESMSKSMFDTLWPLTRERRISKLRYDVLGAGLMWEIDVISGRKLWLAEIELPASDASYEIPAWLAKCIVREVTDEAGFTNFELATPVRRKQRSAARAPRSRPAR